MARNIEIKARIEDREKLETVIASIAEAGPIRLIQDDTFFRCQTGRLKLRVFSETRGELIFYQRPDEAGPQTSSYVIAETLAPGALRRTLALACGEIGCVRKERTLYRIGKTRVHLDEVENLGRFLELEVVLDEDETAESGIEVARHLMSRLGVLESWLVKGAYLDLLAARDQK